MRKPLKVLVVEDSEDDTLFVIRELKRSGFEPAYERVENSQAMNLALDQGFWDVVLSDHSMPGFGSLQALDVLKQRHLDIPFIIVSGAIGEDQAVEAMKQGASDYVMKSRLLRLAPSVERELREAGIRQAQRKAEAALQRSEQELADFFEHAPVGLHWQGPDGTILRVNQTQLDLLGYQREAYVGHRISEFCENEEEAGEILRRLHCGETLDGYAARLRRKDGTTRDVLLNSNVLWEEGKFVHSRCFIRDITESKQAEAAKAYLAAIVESSEDAIIGKSLDGTILSWNRSAEKMYGYTAEEIVGRSISILIPQYRPEELQSLYRRMQAGEAIERYETVRLRKDGQTIDVALTLSPIKDASGKVVGASAIERDITERKRDEAERLRLIDDLTQALMKIRTLRGLLPMCSSCKKIRNDGGYWQKLESYLCEHTDVELTHGICPECLKNLYPEYKIDV